MDKTELLTARQTVSDQFDKLQEELHRLQGEYRTYTKLIDEITAKEEGTDESTSKPE